MSSKKNNAYHQILSQALKRYHDPKWLGEECPLASLYFAGEWIDTDHALLTPEMRGNGLRKMLRTAWESMWVDEKVTSPTELHEIAQEGFFQDGRASLPYQYLLLELRYLRHIFPSRSYPQSNQEFLDFLGISKTQFFDHLKHATNTLGDLLLQLSQPTFRLERPSHQTDYIGRTALVEALYIGLQWGESAAISGVGGIGKTALGKLVSQKWEPDDVFWYTIRPRITDYVESLIYALGAFLHKRTENRSLLWKQLMSGTFQDGQIELYLGLLRQDLELLDRPLLFCFDEVDLLQTDVTSERGVEHRALLFLLENLSETVSVLLMGQHIPLDTPHHTVLRPLDLTQTKMLVAAQSDLSSLSNLSDKDSQTIHTASRGIPRLIELSLALYQTGESLTSVVDTLADSASAHAVMGRLWNRLDLDEQETLTTLAISQVGISAQLLPETYQQKLPTLMQRTLINSNSNGGIILDELIRRLVQRRSNRQQRDQAHLIVADIRYTLGEYTMSAYHYAQAEAYDEAIERWFPHKDREIERGHAQSAREIFLNIPSRNLSKQHDKKLQVICNQLHLLVGDAKRIIKETARFNREKSGEVDPVDPEVHKQLGDAYAQLDNGVEAQRQYERTMTLLTDLISEMNESTFRLIKLHIRDGDIQEMQKQLKRIQAYSDFAHGHVSHVTSDFPQAKRHFENALVLAESANDTVDSMMIADLEWHLGALASLEEDIEKSIEYYERAFQRFSGAGNIVRANKIQAEIGIAYITYKQYADGISKLTPMLKFFQNINDVPTQIAIYCNLSEAHFYLDDLDQARSFALQVVQLEDQRALPYVYRIMGLVEGKKSQFDSAIEILEQGVTLAKRNEDVYIEAYLFSAMGDVLVLRDGSGRDPSHAANAPYERAILLFVQIGLNKKAEKVRSKLLL